MLTERLHVVALLALSVLTACSGTTHVVNPDNQLGRGAFARNAASGFQATRCNDAGCRDSSLSSTLEIQSLSNSDRTVVNIAVNDMDLMYGVTLELNYDPDRYNPVEAEFNGLIDTPVELAVFSVRGLVGLGQVDFNGCAKRNGGFATVTFANEPCPVTMSVRAVHDCPLEYEYAPPQLTLSGAMGCEMSRADLLSDIAYRLHATWAVGDGNSDGETGVADLTPQVSHGYFNGEQVSDTNFAPASADYNGDGAVTVANITVIGQNFMALITGIEILLSDDDPPMDVYVTLDWENDSEELILPAPAGTTEWNHVFRTWIGKIPLADIVVTDTLGNADGVVHCAVRLTGSDGPGYPSNTVCFGALGQ